MSYEFGDFFGIVCLNLSVEVEELIMKLNLVDKFDVFFIIQLIILIIKKVVSVLKFILEFFIIRYILLICLEIRGVLSKVFVRVLVEYISDLEEKRRF